jgi:hypothetical protein
MSVNPYQSPMEEDGARQRSIDLRVVGVVVLLTSVFAAGAGFLAWELFASKIPYLLR